MQRGASAATFTHPARLTDNDQQKKPKLLPPAGPSSSLLLSFAPGSSRRSPRSVPPVRTIREPQPPSYNTGKTKKRRRRSPQSHLQPCKHSRPLVAKAVRLHSAQLLLRVLLINFLLHLPVKFFLIVIFLIFRSFTASFRNNKMLPQRISQHQMCIH